MFKTWRFYCMSRRKYGKVTCRVPRRTHTDRFEDCQTWEQVVKCPLYDDWVKVVYASETWLDSFPAQEPYDRGADDRYEDLCDKIDGVLTPFERRCFYGIAEQNKSLRLLASEEKCSYEKVRQHYERAVVKLRDSIER